MTVPRFDDALGHGASDKRIEILRNIDGSGSISQAARDAGVSYKAAWQAIATLTNLAGVALVRRAVGGAGGGGATLTPQGRELLALADAMSRARLAVQAHGAPQAGPAAARLAVRTSMRNQLPATITRIERHGRIVRVVMELAQGQDIAARVTAESVELLGLGVGQVALALCKATAVRVARVDAAGRGGGNRLQGTVAAVARGDTGNEISVALAGGALIVGFADVGLPLRTRQRVTVAVDEAAVVVALAG